jgi:phosphatidylserine/phosphatidylglycerophosphate/cardiolipin synthase-like enzyme
MRSTFCCCCRHNNTAVDADSSGDECEDRSAKNLSHVGTAAYDCLRKHHNRHHHQLWNVTSGEFVSLDQTPVGGWNLIKDPDDGHDDWFPTKLAELLAKTEYWCDLMSLGPPDGLFMTKFNDALKTLAAKQVGGGRTIVVRMMFANIIGMPVNCTKVIKRLTRGVPKDGCLQLWVGAWRRGVSWNHAKIIAVDGLYLHEGGHNLWDQHYLQGNPVHDLSLELQGRVAHDGHLFANEQWRFIEQIQRTVCGRFVDRIPDYLPLLARTRVTVSEFPRHVAAEFPPIYDRSVGIPRRPRVESEVPIITLGRYGTLISRSRPSDDAFYAMFESAKSNIKLAIQDLGPICIPGTKIPLLGCVWPKQTLSLLGKAMYERGVVVYIALSNPGSIPGGLKPLEACYGNGWSCVDVAAEIAKSIRKQHPEVTVDTLRSLIQDKLRVCVIRQKRGNVYDNGGTIGMHAKHFIVDDVCSYVGSQNLYICDLAEWGVIIDDAVTTQKIMDEYWHPMWASSYSADDCDIQQMIQGLKVNRDGSDKKSMEQRKQWMEQAKAQDTLGPGGLAMRQMSVGPGQWSLDTYYDLSDAEGEGDVALPLTRT